MGPVMNAAPDDGRAANVYREAEKLFSQLDAYARDRIDEDYFRDTREFRSLLVVLDILGNKVDQMSAPGAIGSGDDDDGQGWLSVLKENNAAYNRLLEQRDVVNECIEGVVSFQYGGLNNSMDTMSDVINEYTKGRDDVRSLRSSLQEIKSVLMSKKTGQLKTGEKAKDNRFSLKLLWMRKIEAEETLRILQDLESLKESKLRIQRMIQQKRYLSAVGTFNKALAILFSEDLLNVTGICAVRDELLELKEVLLESIVNELRDYVLSVHDITRACTNDKDIDDSEDDEEALEAPEAASSGATKGSGAYAGLQEASLSHPSNAARLSLLHADEANESLEASLVDPSSAGPVFTRLMVKALGMLGSEEDAENMLLDITGSKFRSAVLQRLRDIAVARRAKKMSKDESIRSGDKEAEHALDVRLFSDHIDTLLDSSLFALRRLLFVLRLLNTWKCMREEGLSINEVMSCSMKESNKRAVLALWKDIEVSVVTELQIHFVERDVQEISDLPSGQPKDALAPDGGVSAAAEDGSTSKNVSTATSISNATKDNFDFDFDENQVDRSPIFTSSARLAAPIYKRVARFDESVRSVLVIEGVEGAAAAGANTAGARKSRVLGAVQDVLQMELVPVIQSFVNKDMREIQSNSQYFSVQSSTSGQAMGGQSYSSNSQPVCFAAQLCMRAARPLFTYWLQLPEHRDMIVTVLDRMLQSFVSSARDELGGITYKYVSAQAVFKTSVSNALRRDPLFTAYKQRCLNGKASVDELLGSRGDADRTGEPAASRRSSAKDDVPEALNALEARGWNTLWQVGHSPYPVNGDKICRDYSVVSTASAIINGCDWLVMQLSKAHNHAAKKLALSYTSGGGVIDVKMRQELQDFQSSLMLTLQGGCKELAKLSEDSLTFLRSDLQISNFYYLHQLAHTTFMTPPSAANRTLSKAGGIDREAETAQEVEGVVAANSRHMLSVHDAILSASPPHVLAVVLSPLCSIVPRILLNCVKHIVEQHRSAQMKLVGSPATSQLNEQSFGLKQGDSKLILKAVVSCQQGMSALLDSSHFDALTRRRLYDILITDFERLRRYVSIIELSHDACKAFISDNVKDFSEDEFKTMYFLRAPSNPQKFEDFWVEAQVRKQRNAILQQQELQRQAQLARQAEIERLQEVERQREAEERRLEAEAERVLEAERQRERDRLAEIEKLAEADRLKEQERRRLVERQGELLRQAEQRAEQRQEKRASMDSSPPRTSALNSAPRSSALNAEAGSHPPVQRAPLVAPPDFMQKRATSAVGAQPINPFAKEEKPHKVPPTVNPFAKIVPTKLKADKK